MAIEKGLYQAPQGIEALAINEPEIEIEIEDLAEDDLNDEVETDEDFGANLADYMSEGALTEIAGDLIGDFD